MSDNDVATTKAWFVNWMVVTVLGSYVMTYLMHENGMGQSPNPEVFGMWFAALLIWKIPAK